MKICNCGYQNEDSDNFCKQCGSPLQAQQTTPPPTAGAAPDMGQPVAPPPMQSQSMTPPPMGVNNYSQATANPFPMLSALKEKGGSATFLIATILYTLTLIASIGNVFTLRDQVLKSLNMLSNYGVSNLNIGEAYSAINQALPLLIFIFIIFSIPTIVMCIGLWCVYTTCKKTGNQPLSTGGFTAMKVIVVLQTVFSCIGFAFTILAVLLIVGICASEGQSLMDLFTSSGYGYGYGNAYSALGVISVLVVIAILIIIAIMVLQIVYYVKVIGSINCAKEIIVTGKTNKNVSSFVGVITIIGGIFNILSGLVTLNLATIASGVVSIIFATLIFSMRNMINCSRS